MGVVAFFQLPFFAKCLFLGEDGLWMGASVSYLHISSFTQKFVYSQTCVKQAPMGKPKCDCLKQVC